MTRFLAGLWLAIAVACGDDSSVGGSAGTGDGGGTPVGGASAGGGAGGTPACEPTYVPGTDSCPEGCEQLGEQAPVFCTNTCASQADCASWTECADSPTEESRCLPPCGDACPGEAYCDDEVYPGYCLPIGYE